MFALARPQQLLNVELDVEKRLQAVVLKDRVRIKQFFIDFDKLRKGTVGEAGVLYFLLIVLVQNVSGDVKFPLQRGRNPVTDFQVPVRRQARPRQLRRLLRDHRPGLPRGREPRRRAEQSQIHGRK